ncbi:hypothetical protein BJX61DRAFT_546291 [Aspergillus egyptiacus]|nr:hypothetical protein BJX61DRAFT_546291 [Aspergillus egyptiacus]
MATHPNLPAKTANSPPTNPSPSSRIPCTYPDCGYSFASAKEMKKHKTISQHDYCTKCDEDFESDELLLIHMIKSDKHIVCPICGIEFRSEGGRDGHIRQNHRTAQNLTCFGCKATFRSAASFMRHIENGECPEIHQDVLLIEQSKKLLVKEALDITPLPAAVTETVDGEGDGGVPIYRLLESNKEAMANQPGRGSKSDASVELADKHWPELPKEKGETGLEKAMGELLGLSQSSIRDKTAEKESGVWKDTGREPSVVGTELTYGNSQSAGSASASVSASASTVSVNLGDELRKIYKFWDPERFFDGFSGQYICPCGKGCTTLKDFERHVLAKSQGTRRMQCPGCLRIFKSTAALIAHCESPTTRCNVNEFNQFAQVIDEVSGGMIQMTGYNEDGTMKYEAAQIDLEKKTTIGVDLNKVGW